MKVVPRRPSGDVCSVFALSADFLLDDFSLFGNFGNFDIRLWKPLAQNQKRER